MKAYVITWLDCTHYDDNSMEIQQAMDTPLIEMKTMGFLIGEREDCLVLGMDYIPEQNRYRHVTWIPKVNIVRKERI